MVNEMSLIYVKGHNWFKVDEERYVLRQIEEETLSKIFESTYFTTECGEVQAISYSLTVANQRIASTAMNIHAVNGDKSQELYITIESAFSMYDETEVVVPNEIKTLWNAR
jgi:hypothetical protein